MRRWIFLLTTFLGGCAQMPPAEAVRQLGDTLERTRLVADLTMKRLTADVLAADRDVIEPQTATAWQTTLVKLTATARTLAELRGRAEPQAGRVWPISMWTEALGGKLAAGAWNSSTPAMSLSLRELSSSIGTPQSGGVASLVWTRWQQRRLAELRQNEFDDPAATVDGRRGLLSLTQARDADLATLAELKAVVDALAKCLGESRFAEQLILINERLQRLDVQLRDR